MSWSLYLSYHGCLARQSLCSSSIWDSMCCSVNLESSLIFLLQFTYSVVFIPIPAHTTEIGYFPTLLLFSLFFPTFKVTICFFVASYQSFLTVCWDVLLVGLGDETFKGQILHLCSLILLAGEGDCRHLKERLPYAKIEKKRKIIFLRFSFHTLITWTSYIEVSGLFVFSETGYMCIPSVLPILKEVANSFVPDDNNQEQEHHEESTVVILGVVANIFQKIIELLTRRLRKEPEEGRLVRSFILLLLLLLKVFCWTVFQWLAKVFMQNMKEGLVSTRFAHLETELYPQTLTIRLDEEGACQCSILITDPPSDLGLDISSKQL